MCHLTRGLFPLARRREGEREWVNEWWARESRARCVSSSKRRSYVSWLRGRRGELLKTNSATLNSGGGVGLEATFLSPRCWLGGNERPRPNHSRAERKPWSTDLWWDAQPHITHASPKVGIKRFVRDGSASFCAEGSFHVKVTKL